MQMQMHEGLTAGLFRTDKCTIILGFHRLRHRGAVYLSVPISLQTKPRTSAITPPPVWGVSLLVDSSSPAASTLAPGIGECRASLCSEGLGAQSAIVTPHPP